MQAWLVRSQPLAPDRPGVCRVMGRYNMAVYRVGIAQSVEQWSPKPRAGGSSPPSRAKPRPGDEQGYISCRAYYPMCLRMGYFLRWGQIASNLPICVRMSLAIFYAIKWDGLYAAIMRQGREPGSVMIEPVQKHGLFILEVVICQ